MPSPRKGGECEAASRILNNLAQNGRQDANVSFLLLFLIQHRLQSPSIPILSLTTWKTESQRTNMSRRPNRLTHLTPLWLLPGVVS
jgi:hypothetical protein